MDERTIEDFIIEFLIKEDRSIESETSFDRFIDYSSRFLLTFM